MNKTDDLLSLLGRARAAQSRVEQDELIAAQLDAEKVLAFRESLHTTLQSTGSLKPLFKSFGAYEEHKLGAGPDGLLAWGFNQLDEKGPYIAQSRVSYPAWGDGYGRSLAHAEDQIGFSTLSEHIAERSSILAAQLITEINGTLSAKSWTNPVLLQTLMNFALFEGFRNDVNFISSYRIDCPATRFNGAPGFCRAVSGMETSTFLYSDCISRIKIFKTRFFSSIFNASRNGINMFHWMLRKSSNIFRNFSTSGSQT